VKQEIRKLDNHVSENIFLKFDSTSLASFPWLYGLSESIYYDTAKLDYEPLELLENTSNRSSLALFSSLDTIKLHSAHQHTQLTDQQGNNTTSTLSTSSDFPHLSSPRTPLLLLTPSLARCQLHEQDSIPRQRHGLNSHC
jgi:hypothetical protein